MKFWEAVEVARKTGKKINRGRSIAIWLVNRLIWECTKANVPVSDYNLDYDWQVIEPPPKEYDFAEAYQMMKAGKWMKPLGTYECRAYVDGYWRIKNIGCDVDFMSDRIPVNHIEAKWIEVQP